MVVVVVKVQLAKVTLSTKREVQENNNGKASRAVQKKVVGFDRALKFARSMSVARCDDAMRCCW